MTVDDPRKLVRVGSSKPARIVVDFLYNLRNYRIERMISKDRRISSTVHSNGELKVKGWEEVTQYLEDLWGLDKNFFERVVYMSEGDIFRFLSSRSDKASILAQVEEALAIDKLTNLTDEVKNQKEGFENIEVEQRKQIEYIKRLLPDQTFEVELLKKQQILAKQQIELSNANLNNLEAEIRQKEQKIESIDSAFKKITSVGQNIVDLVDVSVFKQEFLEVIRTARGNMEKDFENVVQIINPKINEKITIEEHILSIDKILGLLSLVEKETESVIGCPVCGKPLDYCEVTTLKGKFFSERQLVQNNLNDLLQKIEDLEGIRNDFAEKLDRLKVTETKIQLIYEMLGREHLSEEILITERNELINQLKVLDEKRVKDNQNRQHLEKELYDLDRFYDLAQQTSKLGSKEDVEASIVGTNKALLILDLIEQTSERIIEWERQSKLEPVYNDIATVWNKMKGESNNKIELDNTTTPVLLKDGHRFELSQLSGGEKTSLLIIIRTVLCRKFAPIGFMLLDEPLEHLDSENRQMVVDFLVESFDRGWIDQLIVSTFEESLLRKYNTHKKVNLIAL